MLDEVSYPWQETVTALARIGGDAEIAAIIRTELDYWKRNAPGMGRQDWRLPHGREPEPGTPRDHYRKMQRLSIVLQSSHLPMCVEAIQEFGAVWRAHPDLGRSPVGHPFSDPREALKRMGRRSRSIASGGVGCSLLTRSDGTVLIVVLQKRRRGSDWTRMEADEDGATVHVDGVAVATGPGTVVLARDGNDRPHRIEVPGEDIAWLLGKQYVQPTLGNMLRFWGTIAAPQLAKRSAGGAAQR